MQSAQSLHPFYGCRCFFTRNYYLQRCNLHVEYFNDDEQFVSTYGKVLKEVGCSSEEDVNSILQTLKNEYRRRESLTSTSAQRRIKIRTSYIPLHREVYELEESFLDPKFLSLVEYAKGVDAEYNTLIKLLYQEKAQKVFSFPVFKKDFCKLLLEELENFEMSEFPKTRPNTMNNSGILLGELGFDENFITPLREDFLNPLSRILYPGWTGNGLDSHRAFTVKYSEEKDVDLGFHYDNAEVTLNISLNSDFDDGSLYFGFMRQEARNADNAFEVKHKFGHGVLHRGQHMHGALPISSGERTNLIIWMRSSSIRNRLCPMCDNLPVLVSMPKFGDGFTKVTPTQDEVQMCNLY